MKINFKRSSLYVNVKNLKIIISKNCKYVFKKNCTNCHFLIAFIHFRFLDKCAGDKCLPNGIISRGSFLQSENGENNFTLQENGDLVIKCKGQVIWASSTWQLFLTNGIEGLYVSPGGNVMLYREDKSLRWRTKTNYKYPTEFKIENNGNLVLYSQSGSIVWQSNTRCKHSDYSTNRRGVSDDDDDDNVEEEEELDDDYEHYSYEEGFDEDEDFNDSVEQAGRSRGRRPRSYEDQ